MEYKPPESTFSYVILLRRKIPDIIASALSLD